MPKSFVEYAFDYLDGNAKPVKFQDLWKYVKENSGISEETAADKVASFYTNLLLDGRFVTFGGNLWDLKVRYKFDAVHHDMKDYYNEMEDSNDTDNEEAEEEAEYEKSFEEPKNDEPGDDEAIAPETDVEEEETL